MRTFRCDDETWTSFKIICTLMGVKMQDQVGDLIRDFVNNRRRINIENTQHATKEKRIQGN